MGRDGWEIPGLGGWNRQVSVVYADLSNPTQTSVSDQGLKRITVTATSPEGAQTILVAYRSQWGVMEQSPATDTTLQAHINSEIKVGTATTLHSAVNLLNHPEDQ